MFVSHSLAAVGCGFDPVSETLPLDGEERITRTIIGPLVLNRELNINCCPTANLWAVIIFSFDPRTASLL
ncbi:MAG: hypothetical protein ACXW1O_08690 [Halobacteriota archaeon]